MWTPSSSLTVFSIVMPPSGSFASLPVGGGLKFSQITTHSSSAAPDPESSFNCSSPALELLRRIMSAQWTNVNPRIVVPPISVITPQASSLPSQSLIPDNHFLNAVTAPASTPLRIKYLKLSGYPESQNQNPCSFIDTKPDYHYVPEHPDNTSFRPFPVIFLSTTNTAPYRHARSATPVLSMPE